MGKVKSAILTWLLVAAVIVLALFATISCNISGGVKRYNSFVSSIRLGSELSGEAYTMLYPEGVLSASDYNLGIPDIPENAEGEEKAEYEKKRKEYIDKYAQSGGLYVEKDKLGDELLKSVKSDAEILSARFGEKGYSGYSVTVEDGYSVKISVPTNFTYSAYKSYDNSARSEALSEISHTVQYLILDGKLSLRNSSEYENNNSLFPLKDVGSFFKKITTFSRGGSHAVKMVLTNDGFESMNKAITSVDDGTAYFFVGETSLGLTVTMGQEMTDKTMYYTLDKSYAQDFAILLKSVSTGDVLANKYNDDTLNSGTRIVVAEPSFGANAAIYLFVAMLVIIVAAAVGSVLKYKKLGLVNALMLLIYALVIVCALMLIGIQLTIAGAFTAALGLALLAFSNFRVFEAVRKETLSGRTVQASVKLAYKKTFTSILDLHIVLVVIAAMLTLIGAGQIASCGFIFFIATLASYVLYWFTRFMWYTVSSPVKDKFKFCGFKREVLDDDD